MITFNTLLQERIMVGDMDNFISMVAQAFDEAPTIMEEAKPYYDSLYQDAQQWMVHIAKKMNMTLAETEQYNSYEDMVNDVKQNHHISVSKEYKDHPYWTDYEYRVVRITHDYLAHSIVGKPFGPKGEIEAYNVHCKLFSSKSLPALFTEIVGTNCWYCIHGHAPQSKFAILYGFDYKNIGKTTGPIALRKHIRQLG